MFDFIDIKLIDIIDIFLVALLVYYVYKLIRGTAAISIFSGIILIYNAWIVDGADAWFQNTLPDRLYNTRSAPLAQAVAQRLQPV